MGKPSTVLLAVLVLLVVMSSVQVVLAPSNALWNRTYGGTGGDFACSVVQTVDGGYAIAGYTVNFGVSSTDFWLVKTDVNGNALWNKTYGGIHADRAYSMVQTLDGGYAIAGYTDSFGAGNSDLWFVKTDANGNALWNKTYGGTNTDFGNSVVQTLDGGYAIAGYTYSYGAGNGDFWLVKTDANGNALWNKTYGGTGNDYAFSLLVQASDGGYAMAGYTDSYGVGDGDFWLVKTDANGNALWNKTYGGTYDDNAYSVEQASEGGYAITGNTRSFGAGGYDFWLVKTDSNGNEMWNRTYGGTGDDLGKSVVQAFDGGYALAGDTYSFGAGSSDLWLIKTDDFGVIPEGPSIIAIVLLSSVVLSVGSYLGKRPKIRNSNHAIA